jgi:phosphoribosylaminoimidazole-succinocarboxamide synthase
LSAANRSGAAAYERLGATLDTLPVLVEGESKVVRLLPDGNVAIQLKPTLFSYKANRADSIPGTEALRLRISELLWDSLRRQGIETTIIHVGADYYVSERVAAPPIEVIVKAAHVGTPKHIYKGMDGFLTRDGGRVLQDQRHEPYVRFDWRNPLPERDECLPIALADRFIDCEVASQTALAAFRALDRRLSRCGISILDICFFITADGRKIFGEVSPDCMRAKRTGVDLDKDLWRQGRDGPTIIRRWTEFLDLLEGSADD